MRHKVYLIPGFFGFASFGEFKYFAHVSEVLTAALGRHGLDSDVHHVVTHPTASLTKRAAKIVETIADTDPDGGCAIHLVGHSTGGLDARLLVVPGVELPTSDALDPIVGRIRSITTVASPNYGSPQARILATPSGRVVLKALSIMTLHSIRLGSVPLPALVALAGALTGSAEFGGPVAAIANQVYAQLLKDFDSERRHTLDEYFMASAREQTLLAQLTPEAMEVFNATVRPRSHPRCGCVITMSPAPSVSDNLALGLAPTAQATHALYRALHAMASTFPSDMAPPLNSDQSRALENAYGRIPSVSANDGIVPVRSQVLGEVIHAAHADHMDVIGHLDDPDTTPAHVDWLTTRSGFTREDFESLWSDVAAFVAGAPSQA